MFMAKVQSSETLWSFVQIFRFGKLQASQPDLDPWEGDGANPLQSHFQTHEEQVDD